MTEEGTEWDEAEEMGRQQIVLQLQVKVRTVLLLEQWELKQSSKQMARQLLT